ncbi:hypothetical protein D3C86_1421110 [compost metagenome]
MPRAASIASTVALKSLMKLLIVLTVALVSEATEIVVHSEASTFLAVKTSPGTTSLNSLVELSMVPLMPSTSMLAFFPVVWEEFKSLVADRKFPDTSSRPMAELPVVLLVRTIRSSMAL